MGIKKHTIETYACDRKSCTKSSEDKADFEVIEELINGKKEKLVLCGADAARHRAFIGEYEVEGAAAPAKELDYDPQTYPQMQKLTPADRDKHYQAKTWALGPDSTLPKTKRPGGVRGLAGDAVMSAYETYLREEEVKEMRAAERAEIEAGVRAAAGAK